MVKPAGSNPHSLICVGVISAAHGVRGEVKILSHTENPRDITRYGTLYNQTGEKEFRLSITGIAGDRLIARIDGVHDRNAAELLKNTQLFIHREALPESEEGEYYYNELIGLSVIRENGEPYGTIAYVHNYGAGDIIGMTLLNGEEEMLPFSPKFFSEVHRANKTITVYPPDYIEGEDKQ